MSLWFRPCRISFNSVKELAHELGAKRILHRGSNYRFRSFHRVVNWGNSCPSPYPIWLNQPEAVARAVNKLTTWDLLSARGVPTVDYTNDPAMAQEWVDSGLLVYGRETLTGFGGRGISVFRRGDSVLGERADTGTNGTINHWTKGFPTHREFRVVVVGGNAVVVREKKKRRGTNPDMAVRSHGDWVFCINDLQPYPDTLTGDSIRAVMALGLDIGGVDIALDRQGNTCVLEVNTAPSLTGTSVLKVAEAIRLL